MKAQFILSRSKVIEQYEKINAISDEVSYSFKSNPEVAEILQSSTDSNFSVHSLRNIDRIKDKKKIWLFAQGWNKDEINEIINKGVKRFVVDNGQDLNLLIEYIKKNNIEIDLLLRMKLKENTIHTGKYFVFGMYSSKINELIPQLKKNKNISKLGIHFHRKTQNTSEWSLKYELEQVLSKETFDAIDMINIGGGMPSRYKNYSRKVIDHIFVKIKEFKGWLNSKGIEVILEPGRFIAAPSIKLKATIKNIYDNNIIVNCSVYNSSVDTFVANIRLVIEGELEKGEPYTIKGCTPCSMDIFRYRVFLDNPKAGDEIVFLNAGAYNFTTDFCNLERIETIIED